MEADILISKYDTLLKVIESYGPGAVAFSGGVDSTLLLKATRDVFGPDSLALHISSILQKEHEASEARTIADNIGVKFVQFDCDPLQWPDFVANPEDRCYFCKKNIYKMLFSYLKQKSNEILYDGSNVDDMSDYRPGKKAIAEFGVKTPLIDADLRKNDIRIISKGFDLPTWNKFSSSCLATRIATGIPITKKDLQVVAVCEKYLSDQGFKGIRVRFDPEKRTAYIEFEQGDFAKFAHSEERGKVKNFFYSMGLRKVFLDLSERDSMV